MLDALMPSTSAAASSSTPPWRRRLSTCSVMTGRSSFPQGIPASFHALASSFAASVVNLLGWPRRLVRLDPSAQSVRIARLRLSPVTAQNSSRNLPLAFLPLISA